MQTNKIKTVDKPEQAEQPHLLKKIGSTTYEVSIYFSKTSKETISDKILRLIKTEVSGK
jgi:hypothetical protein